MKNRNKYLVLLAAFVSTMFFAPSLAANASEAKTDANYSTSVVSLSSVEERAEQILENYNETGALPDSSVRVKTQNSCEVGDYTLNTIWLDLPENPATRSISTVQARALFTAYTISKTGEDGSVSVRGTSTCHYDLVNFESGVDSVKVKSVSGKYVNLDSRMICKTMQILAGMNGIGHEDDGSRLLVGGEAINGETVKGPKSGETYTYTLSPTPDFYIDTNATLAVAGGNVRFNLNHVGSDTTTESFLVQATICGNMPDPIIFLGEG